MKKISVNLIASAISLWVVSNLVDSMIIDSFKNLILLTIILGFLNFFVKPIIKTLALPANLLTLGLFSFVINAVVLKMAFFFVSGAELRGFLPAIISAILLSIINCIISSVIE